MVPADGLHDPFAVEELDVPHLHDVGVVAGLPGRIRGVEVGEDEPVATAGTGVEVLEPADHALGRKPGDERLGVDQSGVDDGGGSVDDPR